MVTMEEVVELYGRMRGIEGYSPGRFKGSFQKAADQINSLKASPAVYVRAQFQRKPYPFPTQMAGPEAAKLYREWVKQNKGRSVVKAESIHFRNASEFLQIYTQLGFDLERLLLQESSHLHPMFRVFIAKEYGLQRVVDKWADAAEHQRMMAPELEEVYGRE